MEIFKISHGYFSTVITLSIFFIIPHFRSRHVHRRTFIELVAYFRNVVRHNRQPHFSMHPTDSTIFYLNLGFFDSRAILLNVFTGGYQPTPIQSNPPVRVWLNTAKGMTKYHKGPQKTQRIAKEHYGLGCRKLAPTEINARQDSSKLAHSLQCLFCACLVLTTH